MATLGEAFIEVHADTKPFARELGPQLKAILKELDGKIDKDSVKLGQNMAKGVSKGVDKDSNRISRSVRKIGDKLGKEGETWVDKLLRPFHKMSKGNFILTRLFGEFVVAIGKATQKVIQFAGKVERAGVALVKFGAAIVGVAVAGFKMLFGIVVDTTKVVGNLSKAWSAMVAAFAELIGQLISMLPMLVGLAAALVLVVGGLTALVGVLVVIAAPFANALGIFLALPAAVTGFLAVLFPLILAMKDLGEVFKLINEKDPKKLAEGLKTLSPTMRSLTKILRTFAPAFKRLADTVQLAFFDPILKRLKPALDNILSVLLVGFSEIGSALGQGVAQLITTLASPAVVDPLLHMFDTIATFLTEHTDTLSTAVVALVTAADAGMPTVLFFLGKLTEFITSISNWITKTTQDKRFQGWLDRAKEDLGAIKRLVFALIDMFIEMFSQTDEGGRKFLDKITATIKKITDWLKSPEGKQAMQDLVTLALQLADAFEAALKLLKDNLIVLLKMKEVVEWLLNHNPFTAGFTSNSGKVGGVKNFGPKVGKKSFSGGGVVPADEIALVHQGEPILDPANSVARNRSILNDAGMLDTLAGGGGTVVNVYLGTERLDERVDYRIARNDRTNATLLATGPR